MIVELDECDAPGVGRIAPVRYYRTRVFRVSQGVIVGRGQSTRTDVREAACDTAHGDAGRADGRGSDAGRHAEGGSAGGAHRASEGESWGRAKPAFRTAG